MPGLEPIGRYQLLKRLASGGMAEIFLAKLSGPAGFVKEVVIKRILPQWSDDADFVSMLIDEAKIAVQLTHPNIVQVLELGREGDSYYIAMEYVSGVDLRRLMQKAASGSRRLPPALAIWIACEALEGLGYAHEKKDAAGRPLRIVHRDISPQNILISGDGQVKVTDFGIAKAASRSQETVAGVLKGKFAYMSPEQASHEDLDGRSDLFSLAVVLYELLSGERLFYRGSDLDTLDRVRRGIVEFSATAKAAIPQALQEILLKALERTRELRFARAGDFRKALLDCAQALGWSPSREGAAALMQDLFGEETRLIPEASGTGLELTRTVMQPAETKVLAQNETAFYTEVTRVLPEISKMHPPAVSPPEARGRRFLWMALAATAGVFVIGSLFSPNKNPTPSETKNIPKEVPSKQAIADRRPVPPEVSPPATGTALPESRPTVGNPQEAFPGPLTFSEAVDAQPETRASREPKGDLPLAPIVKLPPPKSGRGFLSVQATPWGSVSVDGGASRETPLKRLAVREGAHNVRIFYEPDGSVFSRVVTVVSDREIVCIASFGKRKSFRCDD